MSLSPRTPNRSSHCTNPLDRRVSLGRPVNPLGAKKQQAQEGAAVALETPGDCAAQTPSRTPTYAEIASPKSKDLSVQKQVGQNSLFSVHQQNMEKWTQQFCQLMQENIKLREQVQRIPILEKTIADLQQQLARAESQCARTSPKRQQQPGPKPQRRSLRNTKRRPGMYKEPSSDDDEGANPVPTRRSAAESDDDDDDIQMLVSDSWINIA